MLGHLGARLFACLAAGAVAVRPPSDMRSSSEDGAALFQKVLQLDGSIDRDGKAKLLHKVWEDRTLRGYFMDVADTQLKVQNLLLRHVSSTVTTGLANYSLQMEGKQLPTMPSSMPLMPGMGSGGMISIDATKQMQVVEEILDALGSDDFIRNFTKLQGDMADLADWFNVSTAGHMDLFKKNSENSSREEFTADVTHFLRNWQNMELDFFVSMIGLETEFTGSMPQSLFKADYKTRALEAHGNISLFVEAVKEMSEPNMTGHDGSIFCPFMGELVKVEPQLKDMTRQIETSLASAQRLLPTIGRMFGQLLPEDDVEAQQMTPRLLFTLGVTLNSTQALIGTLVSYSGRMTGELAPLIRDKMRCEEEPVGDKSGAACPLRGALLAGALSMATAWASSRL
mmetsp:Transcript_80431/g.213489  ORF Transcript_80431/g.213489 Transcript_80431/m.213489 type:complete len:398 (-) Transcript_80431:190-1383(-)